MITNSTKRRLISAPQRERLEAQEKVLRQIDPDLKANESLAEYSSFHIGGPADFFSRPRSFEQLSALVVAAKELDLPVFYLGSGSNLLISDQGIRGLVIRLRDLCAIEYLGALDQNDAWPVPSKQDEAVLIRAEAGIPMRELAEHCEEWSLSGLEFTHGIPGSLGGAIFMNAGAYGGQMAEHVVAVRYMDHEGKLHVRTGEGSNFSYRRSYFMDERVMVLDVILQVVPGVRETIRQTMDYLMDKRQASQPLEYPSAGSIFKRPEGFYAGKLISDAGLKGCRIGGAVVSQKHAGFIINPEKHATANDVRLLIRHIQETVLAEFNVQLELELRFVGDWGGLEENL